MIGFLRCPCPSVCLSVCLSTQITAALIVLFKAEEAKEPLKELYPKFLPVLLARIGNSLDLQPVDPKAKERTSMRWAALSSCIQVIPHPIIPTYL